MLTEDARSRCRRCRAGTAAAATIAISSRAGRSRAAALAAGAGAANGQLAFASYEQDGTPRADRRASTSATGRPDHRAITAFLQDLSSNFGLPQS